MEKDVARIPKNSETEIIIRVDDFGGKIGVTVREFVKSERYTGFTKAGTRISVENFPAFKAAINSIDEAELSAMKTSEEAIEKSKNFLAKKSAGFGSRPGNKPTSGDEIEF